MGRIIVEDVSLEFKVSALGTKSFKHKVLTKLRTGAETSRTFRALEGVGFSVAPGEAVALIGHNGCGKSTLLRVLAGIYRPRSGRVVTEGRIAPLIELSAGFDAELSGYENIYLACAIMGLSLAEIDDKLESIVEFAELEEQIQLPFKNFSSGMQARLAFACATAVDPSILLVDEVLAVGDINFARKCLERVQQMRDKGTTLVFVSHDEAAIRRFCARSILLESGRMLFDGSTPQALTLYKQRMEARFRDKVARLSSEKGEFTQDVRETLQEEGRRLVQEGAVRIPGVSVKASLIQGDVSMTIDGTGTVGRDSKPGEGRTEAPVDLAKPFRLGFELRVKDVGHFQPPCTVGFALHTKDDVRLGGCNTLLKACDVPIGRLEEDGTCLVEFRFPEGLPFLAPGIYILIVGVHDHALARELVVTRVMYMHAVNSRCQSKGFTDVVDLVASIDGVDVRMVAASQ